MAKYNKETFIVDEFIKDPIKDNTLIFFSHFGRYYYASKALDIKGTDIIIDASCGEGYGSYALSKLAKQTFGLDVNEEYIQSARKHYYDEIGKYENNKIDLTFLTYNDFYKFNWNITADKIVSIETFEHVPKNEIEEFIDRLMNKLKIGGSMFLTVPLGDNEPSDYNPWHQNEPNLQFLQNIFFKYFKKIDIEIDNFTNSFGYDCQYCFLILKDKK